MVAESKELMVLADTAISGIENLVVATVEQRTDVAYKLKVIKGFRKQLEDARVSEKEPHLAASREVDAKYKPVQARLEQADKAIQGLMLSFDNEQARLVAVEQARLQEIARQEQAKLAAQAAEVESKAREKAEALRKEAEAAVAAGRAEEAAKLAARAQATEDKAEAKAGEIELRAAQVIVPIISNNKVKISGQSTIETWFATVVDASVLPREWLVPDQSALDAFAKISKGVKTIPGVVFDSRKAIRSGS